MENTHNAELAAPAESRPASAALGKRVLTNGGTINDTGRAGSEPVDANALNRALKDFEDARRTRDRTPGASPSRKRQRIYGDRYAGNSHMCEDDGWIPGRYSFGHCSGDWILKQ